MSYADAIKRSVASNALTVDRSQKLTWDGVPYLINNVPGDGNCYFYCLSLAFHGNISKATEIRQQICGYISTNWMDWAERVKLFHNKTMTWNKYHNTMVNGNEWATSAEVEATNLLFRRNIRILLRGTNQRISSHMFNSEISEPGNYISLLLDHSHYRLLTVEPSLRQTPLGSNQSSESRQVTSDHDVASTQAEKEQSQTSSIAMQDHTYSNSQQDINSHTSSPIRFHVHPGNNSTEHVEESSASPRRKAHDWRELEICKICRKFGITYIAPTGTESTAEKRRRKYKLLAQIRSVEKNLSINTSELPDAPPLSEDNHFNETLDAIRRFEIKQMSYKITHCSVCHEVDINLESSEGMCKQCKKDKNAIKMFSTENKMNPGRAPEELQDLTMVEQQLICQISPCISVHMLKHGGIGSSGHCVTFPQSINEPARIFPRLPSEIKVVKVRKQGRNDTSREFLVRRRKVQQALEWLKKNNPVYYNIEISHQRLSLLPENGEIPEVETINCTNITSNIQDEGPAPHQVDPGNVADEESHSGVLLNDEAVDVRQEVESIVREATGPNHGPVTVNRIGNVTIPWPTRDSTPISEYTTRNFFTLAFPTLFPYAEADFHMNRPRTCHSMANWAKHLLWFYDGRFANHQYFKFVVHNILSRKRAQESCNFIINQKLGDQQITIDELKEELQSGNNSIVNKILYFSATLRGSQQYWAQRARELRSLIQYKIHQGDGLPSFFTTGSCAEFYMKPLKRLLRNFILLSTGQAPNLDHPPTMFKIVQENSHIVGKYFDLRTKCYFDEVMAPVFGVNSYWYRQEFAKSRGMIHWHGLAWREDQEPHNLLHEGVTSGLSNEECAENLANWAAAELGMTASHPAGVGEDGMPRKDLWPPPEGTAPPPPEEKNPLVKLLLDVSSSQDSILEDYLLLTNRFNMHRCSDYCLRKRGNQRVCRMEFGSENNPGKPLREKPAMCKDRNGCLRLEMARDHPMLVQHSRYHTQGWRANGDMSIILSKSGAKNPSVEDIIATERYITGYACKGNEGTGALVDLFHDITGRADDSVSGSSLVSRFLMGTVKRDVSSVETSFELSGLPLFRCTHSFVNVSLSGSRLYERNGNTICKNSLVDKYLRRSQDDMSSLYDFASRGSKVPVITGTTKASWPLTEEYCRCTLILHWRNWRHLSEIRQEQSWVTQFENFLKSDICPNFVKAEVQRAKDYSERPANDGNVEDSSDNDDHVEQPDWMDLVRPNVDYEAECNELVCDDGGPDFDWSKTTLAYPLDLADTWIEQLDRSENEDTLQLPDVDINCLNAGQRLAYNIVMKSLQDYTNKDIGFQPLRLIVGGTAGSGKSYLIKCLMKSVRLLFKSNKAIQVLCPTGNSANIIGGMTLHSFLKLPINKKNGEMKVPDGERGKELQKNCDGLQVLLVDERSLIGATTLGWMEFLSRYGVNNGKDCDKSWGGLPVVAFFGDYVQLPPVLESAIYMPNPSVPAAKQGALVWTEFSNAVLLESIVRQQGNAESQFREVLNSVRSYKITSEQASWLQKFQWDDLKLSHGSELLDRISREGLFVFPSRREEWEHNKAKLLEANRSVPIAKLDAKFEGPHARAVPDDKAGGLPKVVYLCQNAKVTLTANLSIKHGLYNRSPGIVMDIVYLDGRRPVTDLPDFVMVKFRQYSGPPYLASDPKVVPLVPVKRRVECPCSNCKRIQVPLRLGWGTTIHSCQGQTVGEGEPNRYIVINPGNTRFEAQNPGSMFVALSRAKSSGGPKKDPDFCWHPSVLMNEDRICFVPKTARLTARSTEMERIRQMAEETKSFYANLHMDTCLLDFIRNIQS